MKSILWKNVIFIRVSCQSSRIIAWSIQVTWYTKSLRLFLRFLWLRSCVRSPVQLSSSAYRNTTCNCHCLIGDAFSMFIRVHFLIGETTKTCQVNAAHQQNCHFSTFIERRTATNHWPKFALELIQLAICVTHQTQLSFRIGPPVCPALQLRCSGHRRNDHSAIRWVCTSLDPKLRWPP